MTDKSCRDCPHYVPPSLAYAGSTLHIRALCSKSRSYIGGHELAGNGNGNGNRTAPVWCPLIKGGADA